MLSSDEKFGYPEPPAPESDETGRFAIRVVYRDGVERFDGDEITSLRRALEDADRARANLYAAGHSRLTAHVDVIDLNDGERRLGWGTLDEEGARWL